MVLLEKHRDLIVPVTVIVLSTVYGLFSFFSGHPRQPASSRTLPTPAVSATAPPGPAGVSGREQGASMPEPTPAVSAQWVVSETPSTLYVIEATPVRECSDAACAVVTTLYPGTYWQLPYTLSENGWFLTGIRETGERGYVAVATLSPEIPGRCRLTLPYRVGYVGDRFLDEGYTEAKLVMFVRDAERQVEDAVGRDILAYEADAPNTVNFVISHYQDNEPYHRGLHTSDAVFPNGAVGQFWIGIYAALFDDVQDWVDNGYIKPKDEEAFKTNYMKKTILHEMIHTTGFGHLNDPTAVMCGEPDCRPAAVDFSQEQSLMTTDIMALRAWCE